MGGKEGLHEGGREEEAGREPSRKKSKEQSVSGLRAQPSSTKGRAAILNY
jgi:hypothetical protein